MIVNHLKPAARWLVALIAVLLSISPVSAMTIFTYDASTGQFPTDQGWGAFEIVTTGALTAANTVSTSDANANAAVEDLNGMSVLHLRDTLEDDPANLPSYYYEWTPAQQNALVNLGLKFTMVFQGLPTSFSGKGNVRFGFNDTAFETLNDNIGPDSTIEVLGLSAELAPNDGEFHTLQIIGEKNGNDFDFYYTFDGGAANPLTIKSNPAPGQLESSVYFGANSSGGDGTDILVKSITMETLNIPEPSTVALVLFGVLAGGSVARGRRTHR